ncbi:MAG: Threonine-tRNA ligase [candidate division WS6 bacterium GW2011_GWC1_36_11]|uniref:Threonine--tRNA ligase n=2 Tax=Candidatus Dojkabacteria TaxID=74243 RepID=A0A0G0DHD2_9BACT|nr:MAG: Threonine-tRNA ligase [candidate division WS6 bacterium GW2011_GWC1_36_11]KKQ12199.1 MAG: Threonine-tRNA ligase [candidate division WS6 bacterium GW2011_GWC2_36_7]
MDMNKENIEKLERMRHSASHVLAQAVLKLYPDAKLGIGPAIDNGFYYDFEFSEPITEEDLPAIEKEMKNIIKQNLPINQVFMKRKEGVEYLTKTGQTYKLELLEDIPDEDLSFFITGDNEYADLCRGPHVESTKEIGIVRLLKTAGAYWRGDEKKKMLTRIYGTAFETKEELKAFLELQAESERRNHRTLGKQLKLFAIIPEIGQGLPVWLPRGYRMRRILEEYMLDLERDAGYEHILTPHINREELFKISGHLGFYKDSMYPPIDIDGERYYLKPMNCPAGIMVYKLEPKSYRDLPYKLGEFGTVYRYEKSGELHGLQRVRGFTQNDAHIFCTEAQLETAIDETLDLLDTFYKDVGFDKYKFRLSLSDWDKKKDHYAGDQAKWILAEETLRKVLKDKGVEFEEAIGEAAFYGPKIDVQAYNVFGKEDTVSTIQLDFNLPERFDIKYIDENGEEKQPYMIHRALIGSFERFFSFLIEHHGGDFPLWFTPEQVYIISISEKHKKYADDVYRDLKNAKLRVILDDRNKSMQSKIRDAEKMKIPYIVILGDKEMETETISIRTRKTKDQGLMKVQEFIDTLKEEIRTKGNPTN